MCGVIPGSTRWEPIIDAMEFIRFLLVGISKDLILIVFLLEHFLFLFFFLLAFLIGNLPKGLRSVPRVQHWLSKLFQMCVVTEKLFVACDSVDWV